MKKWEETKKSIDTRTEFLTYLELFRNVNRLKSLFIYPRLFTYFKTQLVEKYHYGQWFLKLFCFIRPLGIAVFLPFHKIIKIPFHLCFCIMRGKPWTPLGPRRRCWEEGGGKLRELYTVYSFLNSKEKTESGSRTKSSPVALVRRWNSFSFSLNLGER